MTSMSANAPVSPQAAAMHALFGEAAATAAQSPVPPTPPGMQTPAAPETLVAPVHHDLSPRPARFLRSAIDAANAETPQAEGALIDKQIADVEDRLNRRIDKVNADMNSWQAQINERLDKLISAAMATSAAAAAPPKPLEAAEPMAAAVAEPMAAINDQVTSVVMHPQTLPFIAPGQAPRLDPWAQSLASGSLAPADTQMATLRGASWGTALHTDEPMPGKTPVLGEPLRNPHPKVFDRPKQYNGSADNWLSWSDSFKDHLYMQDPRWTQLLAGVEGLRGDPVTEKHEKDWDRELRLGGISIFKHQLNMFFKQYITGAIRSEVVEICGTSRALDAWRILADRGCSQSPEALHDRLSKIIAPKKAVATKDVERQSPLGSATLKCIDKPSPATSWMQISSECC